MKKYIALFTFIIFMMIVFISSIHAKTISNASEFSITNGNGVTISIIDPIKIKKDIETSIVLAKKPYKPPKHKKPKVWKSMYHLSRFDIRKTPNHNKRDPERDAGMKVFVKLL